MPLSWTQTTDADAMEPRSCPLGERGGFASKQGLAQHLRIIHGFKVPEPPPVITGNVEPCRLCIAEGIFTMGGCRNSEQLEIVECHAEDCGCERCSEERRAKAERSKAACKAKEAAA